VPESEKPGIVSLFLYKHYQEGLRCKQATAPTAGVKLAFARALLPTDFFDHPTVATGRRTCRRNPDELRARRDTGAEGTAKLPVCSSLLDDIRENLWCRSNWEAKGVRDRMAYLACVWGSDNAARISEYTLLEGINTDRCLRVDDVTFYVQTPGGVIGLTGSDMSKALRGAVEESADLKRVLECRVLGISSKGKTEVKPKLVARRSPAESRFLNDLVIFLINSDSMGTDELQLPARRQTQGGSNWFHR
jgi:hypothetical protein